jgi:hypothetical protein
MDIRKVLAGGMAAIAAGATVAFGAFAQSSNLGAYVDTSGSTPVPPWVIIGAGNGNAEYAKDVVGAADLAAGVAGYATKDKAVGGAAEVSVSGGVSLSTANTRIFGGDSINTAKDTLTSEDLPSILASGTFEDDDGNTYDYDQYIVVGDSLVMMSLSDDDEFLNEDPALLIDIGTVAGDPAYTWKVVFNDDLNFSNSDVDGNEIELFGTTWTISADSTTTKLVVFGGANKQTLSEGESATVEVGGVSYDISLIGVSDSNTVVVKVGDVSRTIDEGQSRTVGGLEVFIDEVFFLSKESQVSSAQLTFGSSEVAFEHGQEVSVGSGSDAEDIDNTEVTFTQGSDGTSVFQVAVAAPDSDGDFASADRAFNDPVFGTVKLALGEASPTLEQSEVFEFDTSGDDKATVKFTDSKGVSKTVEFGYTASQTSGSSDAITLQDGDANTIHVVEGESAEEDAYIVINQDDFSHLLQVTDIDADAGDSDPTLTLKDVFSGTTYEVSMTEGDSNYFNGTKVIDGKTYEFWSHDTTPDVCAVVWGAGATAPATSTGVDAGTVTTVFPTLIAAKDAEIAFVNNVSIGTNEAGQTYEILGIEVTLSGTDAATEITGTSINYTYGNSTTGYITIESVSEPAVLILEEEGEDMSGSDVQNAVIVEAGDNADGITIQTGSASPIFSDGAATGWISTSDSDVEVASDRYGVFVSKNTDSSDQGTVEVYYPDTQKVMAVGIGSNPSFSVSGEGGTVKEAYKITSAIGKLANEISSPSTLNRDVILVGGPCANTLVATLMDVASTWPECGAPFENLNEGMIKEYEDAFGSGQKALVIAGKLGDDTRALAAKALSGTMDYEA